MPNANTPYGLRPVKHASKQLSLTCSPYEIVGGLAANIYRGSAVIPVGTNKRITVAAAGNRIAGVFQGVSYTDGVSKIPTWAPRWASGQTIVAGTTALAEVYDDPNILFGVQVSGAAGLVAGDVGALADLVIGTGVAITGQSGDMLDQSTITVTDATGGQFRIEELQKIQANDYGQYAKALVRPNEHQLGSGIVTTNANTAI